MQKSLSERIKQELVEAAAQVRSDYENGNFSDIVELLETMDPLAAAVVVGLVHSGGLVGMLATKVYG